MTTLEYIAEARKHVFLATGEHGSLDVDEVTAQLLQAFDALWRAQRLLTNPNPQQQDVTP